MNSAAAGVALTSDSSMRRILWTTAVFNLGGAILFAFPESALAQLLGFPAAVPGIYCALLAFLVALFGAAYVWLASQPTINRPMVALFTLGKAGVFSIVAIFWLSGAAPGVTLLVASGDLIFAILFARWLRASSSIARP